MVILQRKTRLSQRPLHVADCPPSDILHVHYLSMLFVVPKQRPRTFCPSRVPIDFGGVIFDLVEDVHFFWPPKKDLDK